MRSIRLMVSKVHLKQGSKVPAEKPSGLVRSEYQTCPVHIENFLKFKSVFPPLILELRGTKIDEIWTQGSPQHKEYIPKRGFSQIQIFPFRF
jgi:hypothetical protein